MKGNEAHPPAVMLDRERGGALEIERPHWQTDDAVDPGEAFDWMEEWGGSRGGI